MGGEGGGWECMVKVVKQPLTKTVGRTTLNYDELQTTMVEIEAIVNAQPLTYVYDVLTPFCSILSDSQHLSHSCITYLQLIENNFTTQN